MNAQSVRILAVLLAIGTIFAFVPERVLADRGSIPWGMEDNLPTEIFEPAQNAVIAWNGREEILVLTTDLSATRPTKVLEVLPLPSEPVVTKGDGALFAKFNNLILSELRTNRYSGKGPGGSREGAASGAEVTFHEKIGAHDISVVHVLDSGYFAEWIANFLKKKRCRAAKDLAGAAGDNRAIPAGWASLVCTRCRGTRPSDQNQRSDSVSVCN